MKILMILFCLVIAIMTLIIFNLNQKLKFLKKQLSGENNGVSGKDLFENITKSKELYRDLLIEFHPDKYHTNDILRSKAEEISFKIAKHKSSFRELISITKMASIDFEISKSLVIKYPEILE